MSTYVIINPRSGGGRTGRAIAAITAKLRAKFGKITVGVTDAPLAAQRLATQALVAGHDLVIAVGGDGTVSETANGFFRNGVAINPAASLAFVMSGTGGDFQRSFGFDNDMDRTIARIAAARPRAIDIGRVTLLSHNGETIHRHFINIASFGLSGEVVNAVNRARLSKLLGGSFAFFINSLMATLRYRNKPVRLKIDDVYDEEVTISTVAICNGKFFGGGMMVAPHAETDDGLFDVVILAAGRKRETISELNRIYTGEHLKNPKVKVVRGRRIIVAPIANTGSKVLIELDGEQPGMLPATFEIMPGAIKLRC